MRHSELPLRLIWGAEDEFQAITHAERLVAEPPIARLVRVPGARHIPMMDAPEAVGRSLAEFLRDDIGAAEPRPKHD